LETIQKVLLMSTFKLDNFRAEVLKNGLAKSHRFEVVIAKAGGNLSSMFAEGTQLPQTRINTSQMRMWGSPRLMPQWAEYGGDNLSINFYLDREMTIKRFFDAWIDSVVNRQTSTVGYYNTYITDIQIHQLDEQDVSNYGVILKEAYPIAVNPVQLDMGNVNVSRLSVTFAYKKWFPLNPTPAPAPQPTIDPKPQPKTKEIRKVDYLGQSSSLGGDRENPMSFETNSFFGA
jgi:hypothetical protein